MATSFIFGGDTGQTQESIARQREVANALWAQQMRQGAPRTIGDGLAMLGQAFSRRASLSAADAAEAKNKTYNDDIVSALLGQAGGMGATPPAAPSPVASAAGGIGSDAVAAAAPTSIGTDQQTFIDGVMPAALEASKRTGLDPRLIVAQAALESGWGKSAPGNNLFGIKSHGMAGGQRLATNEYVDGQPVTTEASFRQYANPGASVADYATFVMSNPRYKPMLEAQGLDAQLAALGQSGYATDPKYGAKVGQIAQAIPMPAAIGAQPGAAPAAGAPQPGSVPAGVPQQRGLNPLAIQALTSPYSSESTRAVAKMIIDRDMKASQLQSVDLGDRIGFFDQGGNMIRSTPKNAADKQPTYGVIEQDQFGNNRYGWIDPITRSVTPGPAGAGAQPTAGGPSAIPPPPPGVDPKQWREQNTKNLIERSAPPSMEAVSGLRKEVQGLPSYKNFSQAMPIYRSMFETAGRNTKASDLNLVYGLGKIMDPTSVVREGEMVMVQNTASIPDWLQGAINKVNGGAALQPETREAVMREAFSRMQSYKQAFDQDMGMYGGIADRGRMNRADVIPDFGQFSPWERPATPPQAMQVAPAAVPPGAAPQAVPQAPVSPTAPAPAYRTGGWRAGPPQQPAQPQVDADGFVVLPNGVRIRQKAQ